MMILVANLQLSGFFSLIAERVVGAPLSIVTILLGAAWLAWF
jgi:hypothetical protein